jgi:asparagine synthase (glutamine-hydrolysing)
MCGIAGYVRYDGSMIDSNLLLKMANSLQHRGPDQTGLYMDDWIGMAHTRLSIIDLSHGIQPIHNEDQTMWIVYNGEVFNYLELRQQLKAKGHQFYTNTDTEVLLHLYEEKGVECLQDLNGQFAFAIWDTRQHALFMARDRVGIRPLHFTAFKDSLVFGSEIKALFQDDRVSRRLDPIALDQIFTFWTTVGTRTAFQGINELPPGHYMQVASNGRVIVKPYWDVPLAEHRDWSAKSPQRLIEKTVHLLEDATRIRLRADVPVGCYLSGGLDSSGLSSMIVNGASNKVSSFGIRFEDEAFDEGCFQDQMVSYLGCDHHELRASNDLIGESFTDVLWHCEKPLLRTAPVPLFLLSNLVRQTGYKAVVTGEGADELFGGYNIYREAKIRRFWSRFPSSATRAKLIGHLYPYIFNDPRQEHMLQSFFAKGMDQTDNPFYSHMLRWQNTSRLKSFFSKELRDAIGNYSGYEEIRGSLPNSFFKADTFSKSQYLEMKLFLSNYLLSSQGDRMAMAHSVEMRLPYLDYRLIDHMAHVPTRWKILGLKEKYILKKCFQPILPKEIVQRPKHPYRAPIKTSLIKGKANELTQQMLSEQSIRNIGLFDAKKVSRLLKKCDMLDNPGEADNMALAGIFSTQVIHNTFVDSFSTQHNTNSLVPELVIDRRSCSTNNKS